jgi:hypothetical protein
MIEISTMSEMLASPFVFVLGILVITVGIPTAGHYWCQYRKNELEAGLKHDMLQRGMSAEEIRTVLETPGKAGAAQPRNSCPVARPRDGITAMRPRD